MDEDAAETTKPQQVLTCAALGRKTPSLEKKRFGILTSGWLSEPLRKSFVFAFSRMRRNNMQPHPTCEEARLRRASHTDQNTRKSLQRFSSEAV
jgi:hypothetical protein